MGAVFFMPDARLSSMGKMVIIENVRKTLPIIDPEYFIIAVVVCNIGIFNVSCNIKIVGQNY
jgi:hypothetical protein